MRISRAAVVAEHEWVHGRVDVVVPLANAVRGRLGQAFDTTVAEVTTDQYHDAVDRVFRDGNRAVNVTALVRLLRDLDVEDDYPGFVVDELLGRELAALIAGEHPGRLLAEATFHYADLLLSEVEHDPDASAELIATADTPAGADDLDAALAAGFQTRLPGWAWTEGPSPFTIE
jgi:hypothetical protein